MKRVLSICLVLCLVLGTIPVMANEVTVVDSGTFGTNITSGTCVTWTLYSDGAFKLSGIGEIYDYYLMGIHANGKSITSIIIENGITAIGDYAFEYLPKLESVIIGAGVETIGDAPFSECENLKSITVDENNQYFTSNDGIMFDKSMSKLHTYPAGKTDTSYR